MSRRVAIWSRTRSTASDNTVHATLTFQHGREAVVTLARARTTLRGKRRHREGAGVSLSAAAAVCRRRGERDVKRGRVESATPVQQAETIICARWKGTNTVASDKAIFDRPPHKRFAQANDDLAAAETARSSREQRRAVFAAQPSSTTKWQHEVQSDSPQWESDDPTRLYSSAGFFGETRAHCRVQCPRRLRNEAHTQRRRREIRPAIWPSRCTRRCSKKGSVLCTRVVLSPLIEEALMRSRLCRAR